ncbi:MAG: hypothetical protein ACFE7R_02165 [Candidatus Hodarchaeota archaeon]
MLVQGDQRMPRDSDSAWEKILSPSAKALIRTIRVMEEGSVVELFQPGPELDRLQQMLASHKGSFYHALRSRIDEVAKRGGVDLITQQDAWTLIEEVWGRNVSCFSKTELSVLEGVLENPGTGLRELAKNIDLSYSQARRAMQRIRSAGVIKIEGLHNLQKLGLQRVLLILESPKLVLSSPYVTRSLYIDGSESLVFLVITFPANRTDELLNLVRSLRSTSHRVTAWRLSKGRSKFSGMYSSEKKCWNLDLFHWKLQLRKDESQITVSYSSPDTNDRTHFTAADLKILDHLVNDFDAKASEIVEATGLSESTAFRRRATLIEENAVVPRARVRIPILTDRVLVSSDPECASNLLSAWTLLPLTYLTQIKNLETGERRVLQLAAIPPGMGSGLVRTLNSAMSRVDDYSAYTISAGTVGHVKTSSLFNRREKTWKRGDFFDARSYEIVRREAEIGEIPLDLA